METVNGCLSDRLDEMEAAIRKTSFRKGTGRANEVNYWVFDYPPELVGSFNLIFYSSAEDAVFKALGVE